MIQASRLDKFLATKPFHGVEIKLARPRERSLLLSAGPLLNDDKQPIGAIVSLTDITARKRGEEQQKVLVAELNHRVKNILAVVQAVAAQTVRTSPSLPSFGLTFSGRVRALSFAHDILTRTAWTGIGLSELLEGVLLPYRSEGESQIKLDGPPILLPARAVVPLSMAFHEMATNASKYGSLTSPIGSVAIDWKLIPNGVSRVALEWREQGGPSVKPGQQKGFGTTLIQRVIVHDLEGSVDLHYEPEGMRGVLTFPLSSQIELNDLSGGAKQ